MAKFVFFAKTVSIFLTRKNVSCKSVPFLTLSLTGVGPIGPSPSYMQISLKVLKVRYRQKLGIPEAGSWACFEIRMVPILDLICLLLIFS